MNKNVSKVKVLTEDEKVIKLHKMAKTLAFRYNSEAHYDDLVQEGLLIALETLKRKPKAKLPVLYGVMKKRMYDYLNFSTKAVYIPPSDTARSVSRGNHSPNNSSYSEAGIEALRVALTADLGGYDDDKVEGKQKTPEQHLLEKEMWNEICKSVNRQLTATEKRIVELRYFKDKTQKELAREFKMSQQALQQKEKQILGWIKSGLPQQLRNNL